jgi:hypothetical protein
MAPNLHRSLNHGTFAADRLSREQFAPRFVSGKMASYKRLEGINANPKLSLSFS